MEAPNSKGSSHFVVGLFLLIALIVAAGFIVFMGGSSIFSTELRMNGLFKDARGLNVGAPVYMAGVDVGRVLGKSLPPPGEKGVLVTFSVDGRYRSRLRSTTSVAISSAGMLGDKTIVIVEGEGGELIEDGGRVPILEEKDLNAYIEQGGEAIGHVREITEKLALLMKDKKVAARFDLILSNLEAASTNLKRQTEGNWGAKLDSTLTKLDSILTKVDKGQGTLGALINDSSLHEDLRVLLGGARRSKVIRFLVKQAIQNSDRKGGSDQAAPRAQE